MTSLALAACAALGVHLLLTEARSAHSAGTDVSRRVVRRAHELLAQSGLAEVTVGQFLGASLAVGAAAALCGAAVFGPGVPVILLGVTGALVPAAGWRGRRATRQEAAREAWPRLIEEIRVLAGSGGRSIPQAVIDVGLRGTDQLRPAFEAAQREWALTTDFERTVTVLKSHLADPTADVTCETLLVAAEVGGDVDRRLRALAEDRRADVQERKEAVARQAGARFARYFVVLVPAGMALAGLNVGDGGDAYRTAHGQLLVATGLALVVACWFWASRIMALPAARRVLDR